MILILEGPDASGKSTLAARISTFLDGAHIQKEGPEPLLDSEQLLARYLRLADEAQQRAKQSISTIFDRLSVSEVVYASAMDRSDRLGPYGLGKVRVALPNALWILCLAPWLETLKAFRERGDSLVDEKILLKAWSRYAALSQGTLMPGGWSVGWDRRFDWTVEGETERLLSWLAGRGER